jgi:outer membrane protein OmpA-like peptidoglycan-associated protein
MSKKRKIRSYETTESLNVWPSFTDLMANAFMIISLFLLLALFKSLFLKYAAEESEQNLNDTERKVYLLQREIASLENELGASAADVQQLNRASAELRQLLLSSNERSRSQVDVLQSEIKRLKSAPPVVVIQDSGGFQFDSGSAILPSDLKKYITVDLVDRIEKISQQRSLYVVEIIGHTDGQINFSKGNLDQQLEEVAQGRFPVESLRAGSNADLGLMRALEVVKQLQTVQEQTGRLEGVQFRPYSAAQLQLPSGNFAPANRNPDANRRRIEIRFSPLGKAETVN